MVYIKVMRRKIKDVMFLVAERKGKRDGARGEGDNNGEKRERC